MPVLVRSSAIAGTLSHWQAMTGESDRDSEVTQRRRGGEGLSDTVPLLAL